MPSEQTIEPVDASTVMVVRDDPNGLQVLMLERHIDSDFVGGAFVFPGGKVDESDALEASLYSGLDPVAAGLQMKVDPLRALQLYVAAARETFEESGLLFARRADRPVAGGDVDGLGEARRSLNERDSGFDWPDWLRANRLVLDLGAFAWWSWWVTPKGVHRRFDTRFFVAQAPAGQQAVHDNTETVTSVWTTPAGALQAAAEGRATVIFPTRKNLEELAVHENAAGAIEWAAGRTPPRVEPEIVSEEGRVLVRHPLYGATTEM